MKPGDEMKPGREQMRGFPGSVTLDKAFQEIRSIEWNRPGTRMVNVEESFGLLSAEDVFSPSDVPGNRTSAVDGFAIRSEELPEPGSKMRKVFRVAGVSQAGKPFTGTASTGECCEIYTGSLVPEDFDTIVMAEDVTIEEGGIVVTGSIRKGQNIRMPGEDIPRGFQILKRGQVVNAFRIAACISAGIREIHVFNPIQVSVISTGNELIPNSPQYVPNSSQALILNYFGRKWISFSPSGVCPDDSMEIRNRISGLVKSSDMVVVTGGTSLGRMDLVPEAMLGIGETVFAGIDMRPGKTITLYNCGGKPVFSISGVPGPALTSFETVFEEFLSTVHGARAGRRTIAAKAAERIEIRGEHTLLKRVSIFENENGTFFRAVNSGGLRSLLESDGIIQTKPEKYVIEEGEVCFVRLNGWES